MLNHLSKDSMINRRKKSVDFSKPGFGNLHASNFGNANIAPRGHFVCWCPIFSLSETLDSSSWAPFYVRLMRFMKFSFCPKLFVTFSYLSRLAFLESNYVNFNQGLMENSHMLLHFTREKWAEYLRRPPTTMLANYSYSTRNFFSFKEIKYLKEGVGMYKYKRKN